MVFSTKFTTTKRLKSWCFKSYLSLERIKGLLSRTFSRCWRKWERFHQNHARTISAFKPKRGNQNFIFQLALSIPTEAIIKSFHSIFMLLFSYQKRCALSMYKPNTTLSPGGGGGKGWGLPLMGYMVRFRPKGVRYIKRLGIHEMTYLEG